LSKAAIFAADAFACLTGEIIAQPARRRDALRKLFTSSPPGVAATLQTAAKCQGLSYKRHQPLLPV